MSGTTYSAETYIEEVYDFLSDRDEERWDRREILNALNLAIRRVWPKWSSTVVLSSGDTDEDGDSVLSYDQEDFDYAVPAEMDDVIEIYLEPFDTTRPWFKATDWYIRNDVIYFDKAYRRYDGQSMRIVGVRKPTKLILSKGKTGTLTNGDATFTDSNGTFVADGFSAGNEPSGADWKLAVVESANDDAAVDVYTVASVTDGENLELDSNYTGTTSSNCVYVLYNGAQTTDVPFPFMLHMAAHFMYLLWGHKGIGKDVELAADWAQYHYEQAFVELEEEKKRHRPRGL